MRVPWRGALPPAALAVLVTLCSGCGSDKIIQPMTENLRLMVNDNKPNANERIVFQRSLGDPAKYTTVYQAADGSDGAFGFRGYLDSRAGAGTVGPDGDPAILQSTVFSVRDLCALTAASAAPGCYLIAGAHDADGDDASEQGYLLLLGPAGELVDQLLVTSDTSDVWLNGVQRLDDSTFIAFGGERRQSVAFPFVARAVVTPDRHVSIRARKTLEAEPGKWLGQAAIFPPPPGENGLFAGVKVWSQDSGERVGGIRATLPDLADASLEWSHEVVAPTGSVASLQRFVRVGDVLVVVGTAEDGRKQPPPDDAAAWYSGLAVSYTRAGTLRWLTVIGEGDNNETFRDVVEAPGALLAVGTCDNHFFGPKDGPTHVFGYGWVCSIDSGTGQVLASLSFGQDRHSSGFGTASYRDGRLTCMGWTEWLIDGDPYRGWFCRVDVTDLAALRLAGESPTSMDRAPGGRRDPPDGRRTPGSLVSQRHGN